MTDVKNPQTYGEHYWATQVEAAKLFEEDLEQSIKPFIPNVFTDPEVRESIPFDILSKIEGLIEFPDPGLAGVGGQFISQVAGSTTATLLGPALRKTTYAANRQFLSMLIDPDTASKLFFRKGISEADYKSRMTAAGFGEYERLLIHLAGQPIPDISSLLRWARYHMPGDNPWPMLDDKVNLDPAFLPIWNWLGQQVLATDQITSLFKREVFTEGQTQQQLKRIGWTGKDIASVMDLSFVVPNAMLLLQGNLHEGESVAKIFEDLTHADIHPDYQQKYYDAVLTKPSPADLIGYHLREGNSLSKIDDDLKRIGIHPEYLDVYHTLTDRIPPLNDIITMAVREAFSPGTARRFGQYEDFPREFEEWAEKLGLSKEWSQRYWAAHWGLPSITQGFDMLHRGIIEENDLTLLLKAQDVMPFWRDRLIQMAYKPLTRVDVKRMYQLGVLSVSEVYDSFLKLGYDRENASNMTDYVQRQTEESMVHTARDDIVKAFTARMIDRFTADSMLSKIAIPRSLIEFMLDDAEYQREWEYVDNQIKAIRNLYKKGEFDANEARNELLQLDLPTDQIDVLLQQWYYNKKAVGTKTFSKAEIGKFLKTGLIDEERARLEFKGLGYDQYHIDIYMKAMTWESPEN